MALATRFDEVPEPHPPYDATGFVCVLSLPVAGTVAGPCGRQGEED